MKVRSMTKQIILKVESGIVDPITIPEGLEVVVRDYDMVDTVSNELVHKDNDGREFIEIVFEENEYA
jgi:hypothetical protein